MTFDVEKIIWETTIGNEEFLIVEISLMGPYPSQIGDVEKYKADHRYGTIGKSQKWFFDELCLADFLPSSNINEAIENRKDMQNLQRILDNYEGGFDNPECVVEIKSYTKEKYGI